MARGVGRPGKWETHVVPYMDRIPKLKKQGLTDEQIAYKLGVGYTTFKEYKNKHPELEAALKTGRMELIEDLEDSLYVKAMGKEITKKKVTTKMYKGVESVQTEVWTEVIMPDTGALVFALKNLAPEKWADKREYVDVSGFDDSLKLINEIMEKVEDDEETTD